MTLVWLPILYEASVREPRWQKPKMVFLADRQPVDVPSIDPEVAPIVALGHTTWRKHDQAFLKPVVHPVTSASLTPRLLLEMMEANISWPAYPMTAPGMGNPFSAQRHVPSRKSLTLSRSIDPARAATSEHAAHLRLLDGAFWIECPEPVVVVEFAGGSSLREIQVRLTDDWSERHAGAHFALTNLDDGVAYATDLTLSLNRPPPHRPPLRLPRPDLLEFNATSLLARQLVHQLRETLPDFPAEATLAHDELWTSIAALTSVADPQDDTVLDVAIKVLDLNPAESYPLIAEMLAIGQLRHIHFPILTGLIRSCAADLAAERDLAAFRPGTASL